MTSLIVCFGFSSSSAAKAQPAVAPIEENKSAHKANLVRMVNPFQLICGEVWMNFDRRYTAARWERLSPSKLKMQDFGPFS
jgi:hypothetical protein